jgi:predicted dehydrogenase
LRGALSIRRALAHHAAMTPNVTPLSVGLAGAGPWAAKAYAPMLAAGPETRLAGVWARRPEAARALAEAHGAEAAASFDALLERCDAVAFAVPPDVQVELGVRAARAGRHLMLDKPLALDLHGARRLAAAVDQAGVVTQVMLTQRFRPQTRAFLDSAREFGAIGARLAFLSSAFVRGPYATPWRREHGALHDLGPHALDLLDAALGPIGEIRGAGDPRGWVALTCEHEGGAVSELAMSGVMELPQSVFEIELYGPRGRLAFDAVAAARDEPWSAARRGFAEAVRAGRAPELDVHRGLRIQEWIDRALSALAR